MERTPIGIMGCGNVSHMYVPVLARIPDVEIVAVADVDAGRAQALVEKYDLPKALRPDELLADPTVEIILNLTPIAMHVEVSKAALAAGKHVYSEKPLATSVEAAVDLVEDASRRGLALACAPDTMLGSGFEVGRQALADGMVGRPLAATGLMFRSALTRPSFYTDGATPLFDMAPYYLTALVDLFGPAVRVSGTTRTLATGETPVEPAAGASIALAGVVEFASGLLANVGLAWGTTHRGEVPVLTVYGTEGELALPNPNNFGDPAFARSYGGDGWAEVPGSRQPSGWPANLRGIGVGELAQAIRAGRPPRASGEIACHVVDLIAGMVNSARTHQQVDLTTTCTPAAAMSPSAREALVG